MKSGMKPIKDTIPLEEARQLIADACRPIERTERVRLVDANGRVAAADVHVHARRAAVLARRHGRLRRARRRHLRRQPLRAENPARDREGLHRPGADEDGRGRARAIEIATGAPMPQGADAVVMVEETEKAGRATCGC